MYGGYDETDVTQEGDILASVDCIGCDDGRYYYEVMQDYFEPDEITVITEQEFCQVQDQIKEVNELQGRIDKILKSLL